MGVINVAEAIIRIAGIRIFGYQLHEKEQIIYRAFKCRNDCYLSGKCVHCGCSYPEKIYQNRQCSGKRWPKMMNSEDWEVYKLDHNINIEDIKLQINGSELI